MVAGREPVALIQLDGADLRVRVRDRVRFVLGSGLRLELGLEFGPGWWPGDSRSPLFNWTVLTWVSMYSVSMHSVSKIISRKQKACSCAPSTTGAVDAASGVWRA